MTPTYRTGDVTIAGQAGDVTVEPSAYHASLFGGLRAHADLALVLLALVAASCASMSPATKRAAAVGLGALGAGSVVAAQSCSAQPAEVCRDTAVAAGVAVLGTALAAGATAYLEAPEDALRPPAPASQPYSPVPPVP